MLDFGTYATNFSLFKSKLDGALKYVPGERVTLGLKSRHVNFTAEDLKERFDAGYAAGINEVLVWVNQEVDNLTPDWLTYLRDFLGGGNSTAATSTTPTTFSAHSDGGTVDHAAAAATASMSVTFGRPLMIALANAKLGPATAVTCNCDFGTDNGTTVCVRHNGVPYMDKSAYSACVTGAANFYSLASSQADTARQHGYFGNLGGGSNSQNLYSLAGSKAAATLHSEGDASAASIAAESAADAWQASSTVFAPTFGLTGVSSGSQLIPGSGSFYPAGIFVDLRMHCWSATRPTPRGGEHHQVLLRPVASCLHHLC